MREGLVVAEIGMSLVLLAGAALLARTLWQLTNIDAGFDPAHVEIARVWLPVPNHPELDPYRNPERRQVFNREVLQRLNSISGIEQAGLTGSLPLTADQFVAKLGIEGRTSDPRSAPDLPLIVVSPNYFNVLKTPLLSGRTFSESDDFKSEPVAILDQSAARQLCLHEEALGHRVGFFGGQKPRWFTIVGIVADVKQTALDSPPSPHVYFSLYQTGARSLGVVARVKAGGARDEETRMSSVGEQIRREIEAVDKDLPIFGIQPMSNLVSASLTARRFSAELIGAFSMLALVLASIGVYGVIAYWVAQRTRELGIRMALGARPNDVLKLVLGRGARLAGMGVAIGLVAALAVGPVLRSQLYGISAFDPIVFACVPVVLLGVALAAGYVPAMRAMRVDPIVALREE